MQTDLVKIICIFGDSVPYVLADFSQCLSVQCSRKAQVLPLLWGLHFLMRVPMSLKTYQCICFSPVNQFYVCLILRAKQRPLVLSPLQFLDNEGVIVKGWDGHCHSLQSLGLRSWENRQKLAEGRNSYKAFLDLCSTCRQRKVNIFLVPSFTSSDWEGENICKKISSLKCGPCEFGFGTIDYCFCTRDSDCFPFGLILCSERWPWLSPCQGVQMVGPVSTGSPWSDWGPREHDGTGMWVECHLWLASYQQLLFLRGEGRCVHLSFKGCLCVCGSGTWEGCIVCTLFVDASCDHS